MIGHLKPFRSVQEWLERHVPLKKARVRDVTLNRDLAPEILSDRQTEILKICEGIKREGRGELFKKLFHEGDWSASYPSKSEPEIDLLDILAWATCYLVEDEWERHALIKEIFMQSAFYRKNHRPQWDNKDYLDGQVWEAIDSCTSGYTGKPKEQVLRRLEAHRIDRNWGGKMNLCAAFGAHIALAYDHGRYAKAGEIEWGPKGEPHEVPETGVLVHSSVRDLSLFSGVVPSAKTGEDGQENRDYRNLTKLNDELEESGLIGRIYRGTAWGIASLYLLPESVLDGHVFSLDTHKPDPHPPSPSTDNSDNRYVPNNSITYISLTGLCVVGENLILTEKLNWVPKRFLTPKQKFLVEQVAWGRDTFEDLHGYFGGNANNLRYKVLRPLLEKQDDSLRNEDPVHELGLLVENGGTYSVDVEAVEKLFVRLGGEERLKVQMRVVEEERTRQIQHAPAYEPEDPKEEAYEWFAGWDWLRKDEALGEAITTSRQIVDHSLDL